MCGRARFLVVALGLCAVLGAPASGIAGHTPRNCAAPDALAKAGATTAAKAQYIERLTAYPGLKCASDGLSHLTTPPPENEPFTARAKNWLTDVTGSIALLWSLAVFGTSVVIFVFIALTYVSFVRRGMAKVFKGLFAPRLQVATFTDDSNQEGGGVTALVRMHLHRLSESSRAGRDRIVLDRVTGTENIGDAIGDLGDLAPQLKTIGALISSVPKLARLPRYGLNGSVQAAGAWGGGLTVILDEQHAQGRAATLWSWTSSADPSHYQALAAGAAAWTDFVVRGSRGLRRPGWTADPDSYAYTRVGDELDARDQPDDARLAYVRACAIDPENVGAALNLAGLHAREGDLDAAIRWLVYAQNVLEREPA